MTDLRALSFQHCPRGAWPLPVPTNEERRRAWDNMQPVALHNGYQWDHIKRAEYARTAEPEF